MKEQFTQGEWVADCYEIECNNQRVAECGYSGAEPDEQEIANAHLIAAAPKMYEEIKADIDWLNRLLDKEVIGSYFGQGLRARIESKKALLAAARGEKSDTD